MGSIVGRYHDLEFSFFLRPVPKQVILTDERGTSSLKEKCPKRHHAS